MNNRPADFSGNQRISAIDEIDNSLARFKHYLQSKQKEERTVKVYLSEVRFFLNWITLRDKKLTDVTPDDVISACHHLHKAGTKQATLNKSISILSSFFKWAVSQGLASRNPAEHIRYLEEKKRVPPKCLSEDEIDRLLDLAAKERNPFKKTRNEALIRVMLEAGLRVEEVSELRTDSLQNGTLVVYDGQVPSREIPINETTRQAVRRWMEQKANRPKPAYSDSPYLFVTTRAGRMQPRAIQFVIEQFGERLGFPLTCQYLRNTYIRRLVEAGVPLEEIQRRAGHKSLLTTNRYFY